MLRLICVDSYYVVTLKYGSGIGWVISELLSLRFAQIPYLAIGLNGLGLQLISFEGVVHLCKNGFIVSPAVWVFS